MVIQLRFFASLAERAGCKTESVELADGALYVSTGQGTPGRPIPGPDGATVIVGEVLRITGY